VRIPRIVTLLCTAGLASFALVSPSVAAPVGPAAVDCDQSGPDVDNRPYSKDFTGATNIRSGPSLDCGIVGVGYPTNSIDYHCWVNGDGGTWSYLRTRNTVYGWVKDSQLIGNGSIEPC
jgi:hypothetical protein